MLIDWITARIDFLHLDEESRVLALNLGDRIQRYCPKTGEVVYETFAWDSIRSDSHQLSIKASSQGVSIMGSPARLCGDGCSVFGSGASSSLDILGCLIRAASVVYHSTGIRLPTQPDLWHVTRIDVTDNFLLADLAEVRSALRILRDCEGGRYRVSQQAGDSVYWSQTSRMRKGKAYAKGPHLEYLTKKRGYSGKEYSKTDIEKASRLLRMELTLGREFLKRHDWKTLTPERLTEEWNAYFKRMIGDAEMKSDSDVKGRIMAAAETEGRGKAAYGCWLIIQSEGWERARESFAKVTWYRHLKVLRSAGLGDADIAVGNVVPLRQRIFTAQRVNNWSDLRSA
jgi:II/X family phage/plasmid replication protein